MTCVHIDIGVTLPHSLRSVFLLNINSAVPKENVLLLTSHLIPSRLCTEATLHSNPASLYSVIRQTCHQDHSDSKAAQTPGVKIKTEKDKREGERGKKRKNRSIDFCPPGECMLREEKEGGLTKRGWEGKIDGATPPCRATCIIHRLFPLPPSP